MTQRTARGDLAALDEAVVPEAARRLQDAVAAVRAASGDWWPTPEALRSDPVRAVRERPQAAIALMIVLVILLSLGALATQRHGSEASNPGPTPDTVTSVGPTAGHSVASYRRAAHNRLDELARTHPGQATFAVVDFGGYLTPAQVRTLAGDRPLVRAYLHVPVSGLRTPVHVVSVTSATELPGAVARTGQVAAQEAKGYQQLLDVLASPDTERERTVRDVYAERVTATRAEAKALTAACACVYAVVVQATSASLRTLAAARPVRVVDPAPPDTPLGDLALIALLPEVTAQVPADQGFK